MRDSEPSNLRSPQSAPATRGSRVHLGFLSSGAKLHDLVCDKTMSLGSVQRQIVANWHALCKRMFGVGPCCTSVTSSSKVTVVAGISADVPPGQIAGATVACSGGAVALGGGGTVNAGRLASSLPTVFRLGPVAAGRLGCDRGERHENSPSRPMPTPSVCRRKRDLRGGRAGDRCAFQVKDWMASSKMKSGTLVGSCAVSNLSRSGSARGCGSSVALVVWSASASCSDRGTAGCEQGHPWPNRTLPPW